MLDWSLEDVNLQIDRADVVLSDNGYKRLVLEVKRPGYLSWHRRAIHAALDQAVGYAHAQNVAAVAVSDGNMLYAADVVTGGGMTDRALVTPWSNLAACQISGAVRESRWRRSAGLRRPAPLRAWATSLVPMPWPRALAATCRSSSE